MIVITTLPESKHFTLLGSNNKWSYIWRDKGTSRVSIRSNLENPFNERVKVRFKIEMGKSDKAKYPLRVDIQCFTLNPTDKLSIPVFTKREIWVGKFAYSLEPTLKFFAFLSDGAGADFGVTQNEQWIMYSILEKG